ncbi:hypothetical protein SapgrDRAFT_0057 [Saprospira grandis DSM 2844]|uniref:Uncharacterized protein n=1 Tax=Saprospira grandis DSM 2844 TaxID=694433 RepID=J1I0N2_9BACT|nr:hypothetical protein [Saprospira grandis]EJF51818.1 hypothetical protein SapgrDRAFT_0057 [Saprospira grandis DSM 2844]
MRTFIALLFLGWSLPIFAQIEFSSDKAKALYEEGLERHDAEKYDKAIQLYLEGLKFCSKENKDLFYSELAFSYGLKNELDQSNKYALKVLKSSDRLYNYAFKRISNNYLLQKEYKKLRKLTKKAIKKHGEQVVFLRNYAFLELRAEQFEESKKWLKKVCLSGDAVGPDFVLLGIVENKLGHMDAALMAMTFGLFLEPKNSKADVAISFLEQYLFGKNWEKDCQEQLKAKEEKRAPQMNITLPPLSKEEDFNPSSLEFLMPLSRAVLLSDDEINICAKNHFEQLAVLTETAWGILLPEGSALQEEEKELYTEIYQPFFEKLEKEGRKKLYSYYIFSGTKEGKDNMINDTELRVIIQKIEEERGQR